MAWTEQDERELQELKKLRTRLAAQQEGEKHIATRQAAERPRSVPAEDAPKSFSFTRGVATGLRNAAQGVWNTIDDAGDWLAEKTKTGGFVVGSWAKNGIIEYVDHDTMKSLEAEKGGSVFDKQLDKVGGSDKAGTAERMLSGVTEFAVPFTAALKGLGALRASTTLGRMGLGLTASATANFVTVDPVNNNLANVLKDTFNLDNAALDALAATEDDSALEQRFKMVVSNLPLDLAVDGLMEGGIALVKAYRASRQVSAEAKELIEATGTELRVSRTMAASSSDIGTSGVRLNGKDPLDASHLTMKKPANNDTWESPKGVLINGKSILTKGRNLGRAANDTKASDGTNIAGTINDPLATPNLGKPANAADVEQLHTTGNLSAKLNGENLLTGSVSRKAGNDNNIVDRPILEGASKGTAKAANETTEATAEEVLAPGMKAVPTGAEVTKRIESLDELATHLTKTLGDLTPEEAKSLDQTAKALTENPENAFEAMGIDPAKLDFSKYDKGEALQTLHDALSEFQEALARKTGRSGGVVVSNKATTLTGRLLAQSPDVIREMVAATRQLSGKLTAARMIVGSHGHKLVDASEAAMKELTESGTRGLAWSRFMETLHRHAYLLGALRLGGSEIGRALQSLQMSVDVRAMKESVSDAATKAVTKVKAQAKDAAKKAADNAKVERQLTENEQKMKTWREQEAAARKAAQDELKTFQQAHREAKKAADAARREVQAASRQQTKDAAKEAAAKQAELLKADKALAAAKAAEERAAKKLAAQEERFAKAAAKAEEAQNARIAKAVALHEERVAKAAAKEVDLTNPAVTRFLDQLANGHVDRELGEQIAERHGVSFGQMVRQLGLNEGDLKKLIEAEEKYTALFKDLTTDAGALRLLQKLKDANGDLETLTSVARSLNPTWLQRTDAAFKDTLGNLFSVGTAAYNVAGAVTLLGLKTTTHGVAAAGHMALSPFSRQHALAARQHLLSTWATVHAPVAAVQEAFSTTISLLQKEGLEEVAMNLDAIGLNKLALKSQKAAGKAAEKLNVGAFKREDLAVTRGLYVSPEAIQKITEMADQLPLPVLAQRGLGYLTKAIAAPLNAFGSLSRAGVIVFINGADQFAGTLATKVGAASKAAEIAAKEAAEAGIEGADLTTYIKNRMIMLTDNIDGIAEDAAEGGAREVMELHGEQFAKETLFQDDLEFAASRLMTSAVNALPIIGSAIVPFIKTPLRILERTAIDYTPFGLLKDRCRDILMNGTAAERGELYARMTLATSMFTTALLLADDSRIVVGHDGGAGSGARLKRDQYTLRIGDDYVQYNRLDPVGTIIGMAADLRQYIRSAEAEGDESGLVSQIWEAYWFAIFKNVLNKSWLQSTKALNEMAAADSSNEFSSLFQRWQASFATRFVPSSGFLRQIDKWDDGIVNEATGIVEGLKRSAGLDGDLAVRRDHILGRPIPMSLGERAVGMRFGPGVSDPVVDELERLAPQFPRQSRTIRGVKLNSKQFSRWLELRGQVVRHEATGLTLEETFEKIIAHPEYQKLGPQQRYEVLRDATRGFNSLATVALLKEDHKFAFKAIDTEIWSTFHKQDRTRAEATAESHRLAKELGLKDYE